jgi:hypothetical protein
MKCRNCGTEIADKALICYRCGEATTTPRVQPPAVRSGRGPLPLVIAMLLLIAAGIFAVPSLEPGAAQVTGWVVLVLLAVLAVWRLAPRRRQRLR